MSFAPNERNVFPFELINRASERCEVRYKSAIEIAETSELSYILDISWNGPLGYALKFVVCHMDMVLRYGVAKEFNFSFMEVTFGWFAVELLLSEDF